VQQKVITRPSDRILAVGFAADKRITTPTECAVIPVAERAMHKILTRAVASRHQRAVRAEQRVA
jgi:hypothetical protein